MTTYDCAIIGGGPAGSAAAISLAQAGARVLLLEARPIPHDKLCGEFLSPECQTFLSRLGASARIRQLAPSSISAASIISGKGTRWIVPLPGSAWGLSRARLDEALLAHASVCGAEIHDRQPCTNIRGDLASGFTLTARNASGGSEERYQARSVISAHGKRSTMDRALQRAFLGRPYPLLGMKRHFHGPPVPDQVALHGFDGGYCGLANIEAGLVNLCFLMHDDFLQRAIGIRGGPQTESGRTKAILAFLVRSNPTLADWLRRAEPDETAWQSVGALAFGVRGTVARDILIVGDAAGLIAPLVGDGIGMALQGGMLCARHVGRYLSGNCTPADLQRDYSRDWHALFGNRIRLAAALQSLALRPPLLQLLVHTMSRFPALGDWLVRKTRSV